MRAAALLLILAGPAFADTSASPARPERVQLVGELTLQHSRRCLQRGEEEWVDPHHEIGFVRLAPDPKLKAMEGKLVVAEGVATPVAAPPVENTGECLPYQMRSDWVIGKGGMRIRRKPAAFPGFQVARLREWRGLAVRAAGDQIEAELSNDFGLPLELTLTMHYEGCYGKPSTTHKSERLTLAPGKSAGVRFPKRVRREEVRGREEHGAWSLEVSSASPQVVFQLDKSVTPLGGCK